MNTIGRSIEMAACRSYYRLMGAEVAAVMKALRTFEEQAALMREYTVGVAAGAIKQGFDPRVALRSFLAEFGTPEKDASLFIETLLWDLEAGVYGGESIVQEAHPPDTMYV